MPQGLQCWAANGQPTLELIDRLTQIIGSVPITAGVNGSVTVPATGPGNAIWGNFISSVAISRSHITPNFTISGNTISWTYGGSPGLVAAGGLLKYGRY